MKKFFKSIRKKSPARNTSHLQAGESSKLESGSSLSFATGYDVREKELGKLHKAAWTGDVLKVQQLAKKDSSPLDKDKRTPLHLACARGNDKAVEILLEWKAKTNIGDSDSHTPLMKAVEGNHEGCVALLLGERVELDSTDKNGNTCLHLAARSGAAKIIDMLCQKGANLTIRNLEGLTPLHLATKEKHEDVCRFFLDFKGQIDIKDKDQRTPLMYACQDGSINLVKLFLEAGASTTLKDSKGWTADDNAVIQGHHACSQLISDQKMAQRGSIASTPRSQSATPRGSSSFALPSSPDSNNINFGLPAADVAGDDSGDETVSRASAKGAGSDSWGEDTDISTAEDKKKAKINVAGIIRHMSSDGEEGPITSQAARSSPRKPSQEFVQSQDSVEDNSWAASDSSVLPQYSKVKVSFKEDKELSKFYRKTDSESDEPEEELYLMDQNVNTEVLMDPGWPSDQHGGLHNTGVDEVKNIYELGDDDSEQNEPGYKAPFPPAPATTAAAKTYDSDWDSTAASDHKLKNPGISKTGDQVDGAAITDWDETEMEENPPPLPNSPQPKAAMQVAYSLDVTKDGGNSDQHQDSEWDTTTEAVTLRHGSVMPNQQDSEWDSSSEAVSSRTVGQKNLPALQMIPSQDMESDEGSDDEIEASVKPPTPALVSEQKTQGGTQNAFQPWYHSARDVDHSAWDSDVDDDDETDSIHVMQDDRDVKVEAKTSGAAAVKCSTASDTDDEFDDTETVSEWELEQKRSKAAKAAESAHKEDKKENAESVLMKDESGLEEEDVSADEVQYVQQSKVCSDKKQKDQYWQDDIVDSVTQSGGNAQNIMHTSKPAEDMIQIGNHAEFGDIDTQDLMDGDMVQMGDRVEFGDKDIQNPIDGEPSQGQFDNDDFNSRAKQDGRGDEGLDTQTSWLPGSHSTDIKPETTAYPADEFSIEGKVFKEQDQVMDSHGSGPSQGIKAMRDSNSPTPRPQVSHSLPHPSAASTYVIGPTALQLKQRLQLQPGPTSFSLYPPDLESDDSFSSDFERNEVARSSYPTLLGNTQSFRTDFNLADDDVLSYTSTEFESHEPPTSNTTFPRDVLLNMNLSDPATLVQVQEYIRESKRHIDHERNQRIVLENKVQLLVSEKQELNRKLTSTTEARQSLEHGKLDFESRLRSLEYTLSEEQEKRGSAEMLLSKIKEQLARKEQQFTSELELRQRAELTLRNIQLEMRTLQNRVKELEEEREDLERQLYNAHSQQEQISQEQSRLLRQHELLASATSKLGTADAVCEHGDQEDVDQLRAELYALKMEMERQRSKSTDEITLLTAENEELQNKIEDLKNDIRLNEEALAHATMSFNVQMGSLNSEVASSSATLEKECITREHLEAELFSLQKRLEGAVLERDKADKARGDLERQFHLEKQSSAKHTEQIEEEMSTLKNNNQYLKQKLNSLESKLSSMENELHVSNTLTLERNTQLHQMQQELDRYKSAQTAHDANIRLEKEMNTKLQVKIENMQERLAHSQQEVMSLRQQADSLRAASLNTTNDSHEQLAVILNSLRSDTDRTKALLEDRNNSLMEQVQKLKEELRIAENRRNTVENDLRHLQTQHNEAVQKLAVAEAQLAMLQKNKEQMEMEQEHMKKELHTSVERQRQAQDKYLELQAHMTEKADRLDRAECTSHLSTHNLAATSASYTGITQSKGESEDLMQRLEAENTRLEADLQHEKALTDQLQAELVHSQKVRQSLEALCSNLKTTSAHLEEKLGDEAANRIVLAQQNKDAQTLLKHEMANRSKLGIKIVQLERAQKSANSNFQKVKSQSFHAEGQKSAVDAQLQEEKKKNQQLQKEISNLKLNLTAAKRKLKTESGHVDLEALQQEQEMKYRQDLNRKLEEVNSYLQSQAFARDQLDTSRSQIDVKLSAEKRRLEEENGNLRACYEQAVAQRESLEMEARRFKQLYESEMKWRLRLSNQVHLAAEQPRLFDKDKLQNSTALLDASALSHLSVRHLNGDCGDSLSGKIRADLDRSIAKHLEAAPHSDIVPVFRYMDDAMVANSLSRSSRDYIDILKRKYFVP